MTNEIADAIKQLSRKINYQKKTIDLLYADRDILEAMLHRLTAVESALNMQRTKATETAQDIKADIHDVQGAVEAKVGEVSDNIDNKTVIVKSPKKGVIEKIMNKVQGK